MPPEGTAGQNYRQMSAATGKMIRSDDSILNLTQLLEDMLTACQNIDIDIDSVNINTDEVESILGQIRDLTVDTNNLIAAGNADLAAIEALITAGNALLTTIDADTGAMVIDLAAIEVINTAIETAVELIDDTIVTDGAEAAGKSSLVAGLVFSGVPVEEGNGDQAALWLDTFRRLVIKGCDLATETLMTTDSSPAQMQKQFETGWAALTAPDDLTPTLDVQDYENIVFNTIVDIGGNDSVDVIFWGSFDRTNWFQLGDTEQYTADGMYAVVFSGLAIKYVRCEFDAEAGDTDATVAFQVGAGN